MNVVIKGINNLHTRDNNNKNKINSRQIKLFVGFAANFAFKNGKETFD